MITTFLKPSGDFLSILPKRQTVSLNAAFLGCIYINGKAFFRFHYGATVAQLVLCLFLPLNVNLDKILPNNFVSSP